MGQEGSVVTVASRNPVLCGHPTDSFRGLSGTMATFDRADLKISAESTGVVPSVVRALSRKVLVWHKLTNTTKIHHDANTHNKNHNFQNRKAFAHLQI